MFYILVFLLGVILGAYIVNARRNETDGILRIIKIEKGESPYMQIELDKMLFNSILTKSQLYLDVIYEDHSSQK